MNKVVEPEFSHFVDMRDISGKEKYFKLEASVEQCAALASRFGLCGLKDFHASLVMKNDGYGKGITLTGALHAVIAHETLLDDTVVEKTIEDTVNIRFLPEEKITPELEEENLMTLNSEDLEPMPEGKFDIGELMSQYLALAIDPYLHEDFAMQQYSLGEGLTLNAPEIKKENPFNILADTQGGVHKNKDKDA